MKLRRGTDESAEAEGNFHRILAAAIELGYAGAVIHARTVEQKYIGPSRWPFLQRVVAQYGHAPRGAPFLFGGSGDIESAEDIFRMLRETGVRLVSVARGAIGNPWIFRQARALMAGDAAAAERAPTLAEQRAVLLEHCALSVAHFDEEHAGPMMRKFGIKFSRHYPRGEEVARAFIAVKSLGDWHAVLDVHYAEPAPTQGATAARTASHVEPSQLALARPHDRDARARVVVDDPKALQRVLPDRPVVGR